jgi:hypothetical protein
MKGTSSKKYSMPTREGPFYIYVSEQPGGSFAASILYWKLTQDRLLKVPGDLGSMDFKLETRIATTEQAALEEIMNWARQRFTNVGEPTLVEQS